MDHESLPSDVMAALDACRPNQPDEHLPEVAECLAHASPAQVAAVRRSLERVDRAIMSAVQQAPVPAGLAERLLERLATAERDAVALAAEREAGSVSQQIEPARKTERLAPSSKKWLAALGGALALAASVLMALAIWPRESLPLAEMQTQVRALYEADDHGPASASTSSPFDANHLGGVSAEWVIGCHAIELLDRNGYAYELANRRARGTLYVVPLKGWRGPALGGLGTTPVAQSTSGTTVAAWMDNTNAYFLVAKGDSRAIAAFFPRSMA